MEEPIEATYFIWLCAKVIDVSASAYADLLKKLYSTEFTWTVSGDKNRAADGCELREYFLNETRVQNERCWFEEPCSVLEMLIAFANRASFQTDIPVKEWFWEFMTNLGLNDYRHMTKLEELAVDDILTAFLWRLYDSKGQGGMFPMRRPQHDQREVEIWYQFCEYIDERGLM